MLMVFSFFSNPPVYKTPPNKVDNAFLDSKRRRFFNRLVSRFYYYKYRLFYRYALEGLHNIPQEKGSFILASNHMSNDDPPILSGSLWHTRHMLAFMAKQELFAKPLIGPAYHWLGAFSVNRDKPEVSTLRSAKVVMQHPDWVLAMFPEGTRSGTDATDISTVKKGIAAMAQMGKQPVLPVGISQGGPNRKHVAVSIGELVHLQTGESAEGLALRIEEAMRSEKRTSELMLQRSLGVPMSLFNPTVKTN